MHRRVAPRQHRFRYRVFSLLVDLDALPALDGRLRLFTWNRPGLFSFYDRDHGDGKDLRRWLDGKLAEAGIEAAGAKSVLCYPRMFGYVFNPLSVWFCHGNDGTLAAIVYEVHNTYGERHAYVLPAHASNGHVRQTTDKAFYVSPFLSLNCRYRFRIAPPGDDVSIAIQEEEQGHAVLSASFAGARKRLSDATLLSALFRYPLMTVKVVAAIHYEAVRLMWKGVKRHPHGGFAKA
jgi:DUF1365 family protein